MYIQGTRVFVYLPDDWKGRTHGLCANYNDNQLDDFLSMSLTDYGNDYKIGTSCPDVEPKLTKEMQPCYVSRY